MNTFIKRKIDIGRIEEFFTIEEDGAIWSKRKNKYLKATFNTAGYLYVLLPVPGCDENGIPHARSYAIHRLVACKYIGQCPDGLETSHKDGDKLNNHWTNLEYLTHSKNILKSYQEHGRKPAERLYRGLPHSYETKMKMSNAKKKRVLYSFGGVDIVYDSIEDATQSLDSYRKKIQRCIYDHMEYKDKRNPAIGGFLSFVDTLK